MGCVLGNNAKLDELGELIYSIKSPNDASLLSDEKMYEVIRKSFIINISTSLSDFIFKSLKESLQHIYKKFKKEEKKLNYKLLLNFDQNAVSSDISYKMIKEIIYFLHFTTKNLSVCIDSEFIFKNCYISYHKEEKAKYSIILVSELSLGFIKDFCLKFQFENFLFFNKNEVSLQKLIFKIMKELEQENLLNNYNGLILPPLEYENDEDIQFLFDQLSNKNIRFVEIKLKININNFQNLKQIFNILMQNINHFDNFCFTMMFYNMRGENVNKISELILNLYQEMLMPLFLLEENNQKFYLLKLFFIIYENNYVDYKYFIFKLKEKKAKRNNINNSVTVTNRTPMVFKVSFPYFVLVLNEKFKKNNLDNKKKILNLIHKFMELNENSSFSAYCVQNKNCNSFTNTLNASVNTSNESKGSNNKSNVIFEQQSRRFILNDDSVEIDYNEKYLEFYKCS
jgi:hypothetical protein